MEKTAKYGLTWHDVFSQWFFVNQKNSIFLSLGSHLVLSYCSFLVLHQTILSFFWSALLAHPEQTATSSSDKNASGNLSNTTKLLFYFLCIQFLLFLRLFPWNFPSDTYHKSFAFEPLDMLTLQWILEYFSFYRWVFERLFCVFESWDYPQWFFIKQQPKLTNLKTNNHMFFYKKKHSKLINLKRVQYSISILFIKTTKKNDKFHIGIYWKLYVFSRKSCLFCVVKFLKSKISARRPTVGPFWKQRFLTWVSDSRFACTYERFLKITINFGQHQQNSSYEG